MMYLEEMTAKEAFRAAKEVSGLTAREIADGLGVKVSVVKRYLKKDDPYSPSMRMLPLVCVVLGNTLLMDWVFAHIKQVHTSRKEEMLASLRNAEWGLEKMEALIHQMDGLPQAREKDIDAALDEVDLECGRIRAVLRKGPELATRTEDLSGGSGKTLVQEPERRK